MFTDEQRRVFQFFDGKQKVWGDPVAVYERLAAALDGEINVAISATRQGMAEERDKYATDDEHQQALAREAATAPLRFQARARMWDAIRQALPMAPWNPTAEKPEDVGATVGDCDAALDAFCDFLEQQKKNTDSPPT